MYGSGISGMYGSGISGMYGSGIAGMYGSGMYSERASVKIKGDTVQSNKNPSFL